MRAVFEIEDVLAGFLDADRNRNALGLGVGDDRRAELGVDQDPQVLLGDAQLDGVQEAPVDQGLGVGHRAVLVVRGGDLGLALEAEEALGEAAAMVEWLDEEGRS